MGPTRETLAERVRRGLADTGLTQAKLAKLCNLNASSLSRALAGQRNFKSLEIALIAKALGVTTDDLLSEDEPEPALLAARTQPDVSPALRGALDRVQLMLDLDKLLAGLGFVAPESRVLDIAFSQPAFQQGEELAKRARAEFGIADDGELPYDLPYLSSFIEKQFGIDVAFEPLEHGLDGLSIARGDFRLALVASGVAATRQRFTLMHELGHLLAGDSQQLRVDENLYGRRTADEQRANAFAAAFLMPASKLKEEISRVYISEEVVANLLTRYGVSLDSLAFRLNNIGLIDAPTRERIRSMASVRIALRGRRTADLQARNDRRLPGGLLYRAVEAYLGGKISVRPVAGLVGISPEQLLDELAPPKREQSQLDHDVLLDWDALENECLEPVL
jgi:Zn-dependent peptidase ImmA (M78 family)